MTWIIAQFESLVYQSNPKLRYLPNSPPVTYQNIGRILSNKMVILNTMFPTSNIHLNYYE